ncbi:hypothetical protein BHE74_00024375 [Ensete ventricosum]|nr:hypothetical protein GW17_00055958 [Ensete ventricosum]RWW68125.1 hypothetical protein BHE74_00024375 [Ensete ventricosum]
MASCYSPPLFPSSCGRATIAACGSAACRWRPPLPADGRYCTRAIGPPCAATWSAGPPMGTRRQPPLWVGNALQVAAPTGVALQVAAPAAPRCRRPPLQVALATSDRPLAGGQALASRPCRGLGCG